MVDRWPTLDKPVKAEPAEPQQPAKDVFPPDKQFQGEMEVVTVTRGMYGEIKHTSRTVKTRKK